MIAIAWNNGAHKPTGAGYGLKLSIVDRDKHFHRRWKSVILEIPRRSGRIEVEVNVSKQSFWDRRCGELIHREIGRWLIEQGLAPWPKRKPPRIELIPLAREHFGFGGVSAR